MLIEEEMSEDGDASDISGEDDNCSISEKLEREEDNSSEVTSYKRKLDNDDYVPKKKRNQKDFEDSIRPPTVPELNRLRETSNLFNSNLFRLQIEEMLKEITIKTKHKNLFQDWYEDLKSFLVKLDCGEEHDLSDKDWIESLAIPPPVNFKPINEKGKFKFLPPEDISVTGSYKFEVCLGPVFTVDLYVHIPKAFFQVKDYLNLRYDRKRALYLSVLAHALQNKDSVAEVQFLTAQGCPLKPILELKPSGKVGNRFRVLLWPVSTQSVLKLNRFLPSQNNIRSKWFFDKTSLKGKKDSNMTEEQADTPTPHYNSLVAQDLVWQQNLQFCEDSLSALSVRSGLHLLKVWLHQRHLDQGYGSFSGHILMMLVSYLVHKKNINSMMSSYQVARITWMFLAQNDWTQNGISLSSTADGPSLEDFHKHFEVVFIDISGFYNLCATVSKEVYFQIKEECTLAIKLLDTPGLNSFNSLFMMPVDFLQSCDHIIRIEKLAAVRKIVQRYSPRAFQLSHVRALLPQVLNLVLPLLRRGLGQRVKQLIFHHTCPIRWNINEKPPSSSQLPFSLQIGLWLNSKYAFKTLDRGPPGNHPEAEEFRNFWSEKSQLRRFRDGGVCEAVLWKDADNVCKQIVTHLFNAHLGINTNDFLYVSDPLEAVLCRSQVIPSELPEDNKAAQAVIATFDILSRQLREMKDLPLCVAALHSISPVFRYCEVFPPLSMSYCDSFAVKHNPSIATSLLKEGHKIGCVPRFCAPIEAIMQLEHSSRWSRDLKTVRHLKAAFCLEMAKLLNQQFNLLVQPYLDHMDIYKEGLVFRIYLAYRGELPLIKKVTTKEGLVAYRDNPESTALEERNELLPLLSSSMHGLHLQFPAFGPTARLAKRWLSSQLLGPPHVPDIVTELLVASLFLTPEPFQPPVQPQLGLLRFLRLMSCTDWRTTPLLINLNSEFSREKLLELETQFNASRQTLPPLFLATPYDLITSQWTRSDPSLQILIRIGLLASEALKILETQLLKSPTFDYMTVFRPNLEDYDVLIQLKHESISRIHENIHNAEDPLSKLSPYKQRNKEKIPIVGFDPVQLYLKDLRESFSHYAIFFYDQFGGTVIGVIWKPVIKEENDFKVLNVNCQMLSKTGKMCCNIDGILEDFCIMGEGLVENVEKKD